MWIGVDGFFCWLLSPLAFLSFLCWDLEVKVHFLLTPKFGHCPGFFAVQFIPWLDVIGRSSTFVPSLSPVLLIFSAAFS